jgi:uncharacterized protein YhaN
MDGPDDRLERLVTRMESSAAGTDSTPQDDGRTPPTLVSPVLMVLAAAAAAGAVYLALDARWLESGLLALSTVASAVGALIGWRRRKRAEERRSREQERQRAEADARMANTARELAVLRQSLDTAADRRVLEETVHRVDELVASRVGGDERAAAFVRDLEGGSVADWERDLVESRERQEDLARERDRAVRQVETLGRQREELERSSDLQTLEGEAALLESRLEEELEQWRVLTLARGLVEDALGRFCAERQPAVLQRASSLFSRVTGGRYRQLAQVPGEDNGPVLLTDDGRRISPADLSRGTAEQLYLCQRLALADGLAERGTPMPLLLDDVLVNADPRRAEGMASAVADYAARGRQVLLFTCHPETAELLGRVAEDSKVLRLGE